VTRRVWVAQCLCPQRHAILAAAGEADNHQEAEQSILRPLIEGVALAGMAGELNPWCGLCKAPKETWKCELQRTPYRTMKEAEPKLRQSEAEQAVTRDLWGDMKRSD